MDSEIVKIEMTPQGRDKLYVNFFNRMRELGYNLTSGKFNDVIKDMDLGFKVPKDWPLEGEILLSQFVVIAHKLKMQIIIGDISLEPMRQTIKTTTGQTVEII